MNNSSLQPPNVSQIVATQRRLTELSIRLALESRETADRELLKETLGWMEEASGCLDQAWQRLTAGMIRVATDR
jgi:hypothetical protein